MRLRKAHASTIATLAFVAWCIFFYVKLNVVRLIPGMPYPSDFAGYYTVAHDILRGTSPYWNPSFFYPPIVAFLMAPFGLTDYLTARWIWFVLSHAFLLLGAWLLWRGMGRGRIALCSIAAVWAFGGALNEALHVGQLTPILVVSLVIAFTQRGKLQEGAVGIGFALKYIPGVLAVALFLHRRWRVLAGFAWPLILTLLLPWAVLWHFFSGVKTPVCAHYWMGTPSIYSWSIPSVVLRILIPIARGGPLPQDWEFGNVAAALHLGTRLECISAGTGAVTLFAGIIALALVCRGKLNREQLPWALACLVSLSLAAAPVCWSHYQLMQYPGVAMMLASSIRLRAWRSATATAVCFALTYPLPDLFLHRYYDAHRAWTAASPATLYLWTSAAPLACLGLFAIALVHVRRTRTETAGVDWEGAARLQQRHEADASELAAEAVAD